MIRQPVVSSNLRSVGYDCRSPVLEIEFQNRRLYQYLGVPEEIFVELMRAPSHGSYFHTQIRDRYPFRRLL